MRFLSRAICSAHGRFLFLLGLMLVCAFGVLAAPQQTYPPAVQTLLDRARASNPQRYQFVFAQGAQVIVTPDQKSYALLWLPEAQKSLPAEKRSIVVTMHGSNGYATDDLFLWFNAVQQHQMGILALQWYFPDNPPPNDYYAPADSYAALSSILKNQGVKPGRALYHGFSRSSANSYYVTMFDRLSGNHFFALNIASSGGAGTNYPIYLDINNGKYGSRPLAGTRWLTFAGAFDQNQDRDGIVAMQQTGQWLRTQGALLDMAVEDPTGGHGVFMLTPRYVDYGLTMFENILNVANQFWTVKPDPNFRVANANIPNVGLVNNQIWLIVGGPGGTRLFRSANGDNATNSETIPGLANALAGTGFTPTETLPRVASDGTIELYTLGLAAPGVNQASLYRLRQDGTGNFVRNPSNAVFRGATTDNFFIGVPDVYATNNGQLRLMYVARGTTRSNTRTAVSSDGGQNFTFEYENPFNDLYVSSPNAGNTNVDPAVLKLSQASGLASGLGSYLGVTMRDKKLYLFASVDGRVFTALQQPALDAAQLFTNGTGFFDPTLVQAPDGRVWVYVTLETTGGASSVVRLELSQAAKLTAASAASYSTAALAPDSIVAVFGNNLANSTAVANTLPLQSALAGTNAKIRDSAGVERKASFFFASPTQTNLLLPAATATGLAMLAITNANGQVSADLIKVMHASPGLFGANANGQGVAAAVILRVKSDGSQLYEEVARFDSTQSRFVAQPITFGNASDQLFLLLFGTGIRGKLGLGDPAAMIGDVSVPVTYASAQGQLSGLDQINLQLPRTLIGRGESNVILSIDGQASNTLTVNFGNN